MMKGVGLAVGKTGFGCYGLWVVDAQPKAAKHGHTDECVMEECYGRSPRVMVISLRTLR